MAFSIRYFRSAVAFALMIGEEFQKLGHWRSKRNDSLHMGLGAAMNPGSRQIYLIVPADNTFREEDVSNYFRYLIFCSSLFVFLKKNCLNWVKIICFLLLLWF